MWVPGTIEFDGKTWNNVGVRFKGNSSLRSAWRSGTDKIPFKLDFDEFEDDFPETANQRFYGYKQISLSNNFGDAAFMRETIAYDLFDSAGLVAAHTATWEILLDHGEGPKSLGLYTAIEVIDDTVIERTFTRVQRQHLRSGWPCRELSLPERDSQIEASFEVEGGDNPDWSDIRALYAAIHDGRRDN